MAACAYNEKEAEKKRERGCKKQQTCNWLDLRVVQAGIHIAGHFIVMPDNNSLLCTLCHRVIYDSDIEKQTTLIGWDYRPCWKSAAWKV